MRREEYQILFAMHQSKKKQMSSFVATQVTDSLPNLRYILVPNVLHSESRYFTDSDIA